MSAIWDLGVLVGMDKVARVPGAVKQYRRVMEGLQKATRSVMSPTNPSSTAREGFALHGTRNLKGITRDRKILPSTDPETAQHGPGVYWWKGFPRESNLTGPQSEGVMSHLKSLPGKLPPKRNIEGGHFNLHAQVTGPGPYHLRGPSSEKMMEGIGKTKDGSPLTRKVKGRGGKMHSIPERPADTVVVSTSSRAKDKTLKDIEEDIRSEKLRKVDAAIFQKARRRQIAINKGDKSPPPTKQELMKLLKSQRQG